MSNQIRCEICRRSVVEAGTVTRLVGHWICTACRGDLAFLYATSQPDWLERGRARYRQGVIARGDDHEPWCDVYQNLPCRCKPNAAGVQIKFKNRPPPGQHHNRACWVVCQHGAEVGEFWTPETARDMADRLTVAALAAADQEREACAHCAGTGRIAQEVCSACNGSGVES